MEKAKNDNQWFTVVCSEDGCKNRFKVRELARTYKCKKHGG